MISDYLKARLAAEIPGILTATSHLEGGKQVIRINGASAYVGPFASDNEVEAGIRNALDIPKQIVAPEDLDVSALQTEPSRITFLPAINITEPKPMTATAPPAGSFAASLRAIVDDARAGIAQARADGLTEVQDAVADLHKAKDAVKHVTGKMAQGIRSEVSDIRAELGQISNDLGE